MLLSVFEENAMNRIKNKWTANKCVVLQQTTSENSSVARVLIHVDTLPRKLIDVLSSRTERESDTRRIGMLYLGCCRCAAAAVLLLCCCYSDCFASTAMLYPGTFLLIPVTAAGTVQLFGFALLKVGKLNFGTSLCNRYVSGPACVHTKVGRRAACDTHSLLLPLAAAASISCRWWAESAAACFKL